MTAQFSDGILYLGENYSISGMTNDGLYKPEVHGIEPMPKCSACWRGYLCMYAIENNDFLLNELRVFIDTPAPIINGVNPILPTKDEILGFDATY
jgi:hypothetical protein